MINNNVQKGILLSVLFIVRFWCTSFSLVHPEHSQPALVAQAGDLLFVASQMASRANHRDCAS